MGFFCEGGVRGVAKIAPASGQAVVVCGCFVFLKLPLQLERLPVLLDR